MLWSTSSALDRRKAPRNRHYIYIHISVCLIPVTKAVSTSQAKESPWRGERKWKCFSLSQWPRWFPTSKSISEQIIERFLSLPLSLGHQADLPYIKKLPGGIVPLSHCPPTPGQTWGAMCEPSMDQFVPVSPAEAQLSAAVGPHEGFCCTCGCASVSLNVHRAWAKLENSELLISILNALERTLGMGAVPTGKPAKTLFQSSGCDMKKQVQIQYLLTLNQLGKCGYSIDWLGLISGNRKRKHQIYLMPSLILINDKNWGESEGYGKSPLTLSEVAHFANNSEKIKMFRRCFPRDRSRKRLTLH